MILQGGETVWAYRLGLRIDPAKVTWAPWTTERIRAALGLYLADKTVFPPVEQFEADGLKRLRRAIENTGGIRRWSDEMDIPRASHSGGPYHYWTEDRIRSTLARLSDGKTTFPTQREFRHAGLNGLHNKLYREGTMHLWVERMGLPRVSEKRRARPPSAGASRKRQASARRDPAG